MSVFAGTSGYSYKEWKGPFYPEKLAAKDMLAYYAERLGAVEINNTFYRMPKTSVLETWANQVPEDFRFSIKASRRITHFKRLKETDDEMSFLLGNVEVLGARLGVLLFQLPPNLKVDLERLERFMALLPTDARAAFEFRHESWEAADVSALLASRNCARVIADTEDAPVSELERTADWGYLRLRKPDYTQSDLADWAARVNAIGWEDTFIFFKHEDDGAGPRMAAGFNDAVARADERKPASGRSQSNGGKRESA